MKQTNVLTLLDLNREIKGQFQSLFPSFVWIKAEIGELKMNSASGHCYLEFVEKEANGRYVVARARATIWATRFREIADEFASTTGENLRAGLKVLTAVKVEYHEQYGLSLNVLAIDPSFTLGEMASQRKKIIEQLRADGLLDANKELPFPLVPRRVAVISSSTAAGYEDFLNQLHHNPLSIVFDVTLFATAMQGEQTECSVIASLDKIAEQADRFDVVAIIRGGGATADLSFFDSYPMAAACAQFPLPIITGIGHERDETVVDAVAHTRLKTPTAAAEYLIGQCERFLDQAASLHDRIVSGVFLSIENEKSALTALTRELHLHLFQSFAIRKAELDTLRSNVLFTAQGMIVRNQAALTHVEKMIQALSPLSILKRGYALVLHDGKPITGSRQVVKGDSVRIILAEGELDGVIN